MARTPFIAGNWKMNLDHLEAIRTLQKFVFSLPKDYYEKVDVAFMVPFTDLRSVQTLVEGDKLKISFGAQDVSAHESGSYTGEVSGHMLARLGCEWVVVGHSERREYHSETNEIVAAKAAAAHANNIKPIVCVGEPLEIREAGTHVDFVVTQTRESLTGLTREQMLNTVVAYEPVWAIGTGKVASAQDAQEVCAAIRKLVAELYDNEVAETVRVLYGGSVKTESVAELLEQPDVDGGLVGGASLEGEEFARLVAAAAPLNS